MPATLDDLMAYDGRAELVDGKIVPIAPSDALHGTVVGNVYHAVDCYARRAGTGALCPGNVAFALTTPLTRGRRQSFSPDAAYAVPAVRTRTAYPGVPVLAVEVRSAGDYGPKAEREMADKRADYFEAGTAVVWDVDPDAWTVAVYRHPDPATPTVYGRGELAEAEPAMPGWTVPVDELFA